MDPSRSSFLTPIIRTDSTVRFRKKATQFTRIEAIIDIDRKRHNISSQAINQSSKQATNECNETMSSTVSSSSSSGEDELQLTPFVVLGGLTATDLWDTLNIVVVSYALLAVLPTWKYTPALTLVTPIIHSIVYVGCLLSSIMAAGGTDEIDFSSLQGVVTMFKDPNVVFIGWIHYIAFDLLVARMICLDSVDRQRRRRDGRSSSSSSTFSILVHILFVVPCMFATLMFGPTGFLLYMTLRPVLMPVKDTDGTTSEAKVKFL